jgi:ATP-dependent Zn protease
MDRLGVSVEAHVTVSAILAEKRSILEQPARRLLERKVIQRDELHALLAGVKPP